MNLQVMPETHKSFAQTRARKKLFAPDTGFSGLGFIVPYSRTGLIGFARVVAAGSLGERASLFISGYTGSKIRVRNILSGFLASFLLADFLSI